MPSGRTTAAAACSAPHVSMTASASSRSVITQGYRSRDDPGRLRRGRWPLGAVAGLDGAVMLRPMQPPAMQPRSRRLPLGGALALLVVLAATSVTTATEFPAGKEGYHSYTEVAADVAAVATAHPSIVSRFSIGKSYKGLDIWAVKVSDNVTTDEAEPEVMFDGTHHADEHMATEMTLRILHWLPAAGGAPRRGAS